MSKDPEAIAFCVTGFCVLASVYSLFYQYKVSQWPSVWGVLKQGGVQKFGGPESKVSDQSYVAKVKYSYEVQGESFEGSRLSAMTVVSSHNAQQLLKNQLKGVEKHGNKVKVYFNPNRPEKSFLINGSKFQVILTLAMMALMTSASVKILSKMNIL